MPEGETINPAVAAAIIDDPTIRAEARHQLAVELSKAIGTTTDPDDVAKGLAIARETHSTFFKPPDPPPADPGSLEAIAKAWRERGGAAVGLGPTNAGPIVSGVADPARFTPPSFEVPSAAQAVVAKAERVHREAGMTLGLCRVEPPAKKGG